MPGSAEMANPDLELGALQKGYKPRDAAKQTRKELWEKLDRAENRKMAKRSKGRCEFRWIAGVAKFRCWSAAIDPHHMIGGASRARGKSALMDHKQHLCRVHHREITDRVWKRVGGDVPHHSDKYERVRK
jgi:hypothetical protein